MPLPVGMQITSELKRKADGISRSLSEVFAYLTHGTASLEEAKKLLTIITNVNYIVDLAGLILIFNYIILVYIQLDVKFKPADVKHSSLRTMAKHVRRAMLPGNKTLCDAVRCRVEDGYSEAKDWTDSTGNALPPDRFWNDGLLLQPTVREIVWGSN